MVDLDAAARNLAASSSELSTAVNGRIWAGTTVPPGYDPASGGAVLLTNRGAPTRYDNILETSVQVRCYGSDGPDAWATYQLTHAALHERSGAGVRWSVAEQVGQLVTEPVSDRHYILAFYRMFIAEVN